MSTLPSLPKHLEGVANALTCPQSVLFTNLSLRGNLPSVFQRIFGIDYAPDYIVYNGGAMRWDFSDNDPFNRRLSPELKPDVVAQKFITTTARTSRRLVRTAQVVSSPARWRKSHLKQDLLEDLNAYWNAYEDHLSSLYKFWNVETLLTNSLVDELTSAGFQAEVNAGLPTFIVPSEPNWFMLENQNLKALKSRLAGSNDDTATLEAVSRHADIFRFLSTVYNLGTPPSDADVVTRMKQLDVSASTPNEVKHITGFSEKITRLGELERELTFWKTERLDVTALADYYAIPMYKTLSDLIGIPLDLMFCMTRDELTQAITSGVNVQIETLKQRAEKYCIALIDGAITFYQPTDANSQEETQTAGNGDVLYGMSTSPGVIRGKVHIIAIGEENPMLSPDEIIVTNMTRPELGAALDVALAYVTDEGGRLCHAAIVSREKKKPCVVGLGNATKVLRSGMLIEVDGSAGTVTVVDASYNQETITGKIA
jgi:phosphoenolpyruvate synthase/pyruvate phosphate dikinase